MEAGTGVRRIRAGEVVGETFAIYARNVVVVLGAAVVIFLVAAVGSALLAGPVRHSASFGDLVLVLLAIVVRIGATALYTGFVVTLVEEARDGRREGLGGLLSRAAPAIPSLVVMSILFGIGVGIGLVLLVIPGLFLLTIWAVTAPAIVVEGAGPIEAFGRSRELVRGNGWPVFWTIVLVWLIVAVITWVFGVIGNSIGGAGYGVALSVASLVTTPIQSLAVSVIFFNLGGGRRPVPAAPSLSEPAPVT